MDALAAGSAVEVLLAFAAEEYNRGEENCFPVHMDAFLVAAGSVGRPETVSSAGARELQAPYRDQRVGSVGTLYRSHSYR